MSMFLELIATIAAGIGAAGLVLILNLLSGGRLPRWAMPIAAGVAMLGFTIWSEYTWHSRTTASLPKDVEVTLVHNSAAFYRPWTYLYPLTDRLAAVDRLTLRRHPDAPDLRIANMVFLARWNAPRIVPVLFDCAGARHAPLMEGVEFSDNGTVTGAVWQTVTASDPALEAACRPETSG